MHQRKSHSTSGILSTNSTKMKGRHGAFSHTSILIAVITGNGSFIGCNATTHYSLILLLEPHKVVTELGASCMVQLVPFGFRAIPHLQ